MNEIKERLRESEALLRDHFRRVCDDLQRGAHALPAKSPEVEAALDDLAALEAALAE